MAPLPWNWIDRREAALFAAVHKFLNANTF